MVVVSLMSGTSVILDGIIVQTTIMKLPNHIHKTRARKNRKQDQARDEEEREVVGKRRPVLPPSAFQGLSQRTKENRDPIVTKYRTSASILSCFPSTAWDKTDMCRSPDNSIPAIFFEYSFPHISLHVFAPAWFIMMPPIMKTCHFSAAVAPAVAVAVSPLPLVSLSRLFVCREKRLAKSGAG